MLAEIETRRPLTARPQEGSRAISFAPDTDPPHRVSSFVGREVELADLAARTLRSRLVTIAGPGGVGKTRLMLEVADRVAGSFADGVRFLDVAGTGDPHLVVRAAAAQLGVPDAAEGSWAAAVAGTLAGKHLLVLADNCESAVETWAEFVGYLLASTESVHVLCTSREQLHAAGEEVLRLDPLELPDLEGPLPSDDLAGYPAISLFVERARAVAPDFRLTDDNSRQIAELCCRLDGLPLAIELAAARMNALRIDQLLARLDARFDILTTGRRTALPHQRGLFTLIDWSYQLCTVDEQLLWARAAVFAGGFDLDAVELVCGDARLPAARIAGLIGDLVDKSVLVRDANGRYRLLDSIRRYGAAVELPERDHLRDRHSDYFCGLVERAADDWGRSAGTTWQPRLRLELANLRLALERCAEVPERARIGLATAANSWLFWRAAGLVGEGRSWMERFLLLDQKPSSVRTTALCRAAWLALNQLDTDAVARFLAELAEQPLDKLDDSARAFLTLLTADGLLARGDAAAAEPMLLTALEQFRLIDDSVGLRMSLVRLAISSSHQGHPAAALAFADEFLALCGEPAGSQLTAHGLWVKSVVLFEDGNLDGAAEHALRALELTWQREDPFGIALAVEVSAWVRAARGDHVLGATLFGALDRIWSWGGASLLGYRSLLSHHQEGLERTRRALDPEDHRAAFEAGRRLDLTQTARLVLDPEPASPFHPPTAADEPARLTVREREVAELVARGLSNRDIAAELFISPRTVEGHVEHILAKLGATSRVQIANWASEVLRPASGATTTG